MASEKGNPRLTIDLSEYRRLVARSERLDEYAPLMKDTAKHLATFLNFIAQKHDIESDIEEFNSENVGAEIIKVGENRYQIKLDDALEEPLKDAGN